MESEILYERLKTNRNSPCPCGSGKKYKKCHLAEDEALGRLETKKNEETRAALIASDLEEGKELKEENKRQSHKETEGSRQRKKNVTGDKKSSIPRRGAV